MSEPLKWTTSTEPEGPTAVEMTGALTEDAELERLLGELETAKRVRLDLAKVTRINSVGVRDWIQFLRKLTVERSVELWNCPPPFVAQLNMISNFAEGTLIHSIQVPYLCETCERETVIACDISSGKPPDDLEAPVCEADGTAMVFDDVPELYFRFLVRLSATG